MFADYDGYYDEHGVWHRTKFCFVSCGSRCTCRPPDMRRVALVEGAAQSPVDTKLAEAPK